MGALALKCAAWLAMKKAKQPRDRAGLTDRGQAKR